MYRSVREIGISSVLAQEGVSAEHSDMVEVLKAGSVDTCLFLLQRIAVASLLARKGSEVATLLLQYLLLFGLATDRRNF
jgi:hypothetical protein